jgi:hypothetical protein
VTSSTAPVPSSAVANIPLRSGIGVDSGGNWLGAFTSLKYYWHEFLLQRLLDGSCYVRTLLARRNEPRGTLGTDVDCPITCTEQWLLALCSLLVIHSSIRE